MIHTFLFFNLLISSISSSIMKQPSSCSEAAVERLYSAFPYPPRDPNHEKNGIVTYSKYDHPHIISSTIFGGNPLPTPFRAMIVGAGTGDATIELAIGLVQINRGKDSTILHVDLSQASINVAKARLLKHRKYLEPSGIKILFLQSKFYDLESRDIGEPFDYINCVGVLHHLPDPLIGLKILNNLLESGGGINMMVYATVGRTGIYHVREMARLLSLSREESNEIATVDDAKIVLESLPKTNWFAKNSLARGSQEMQHMGDVGLADLIMNPCDIAMSITEVSTFAQNAGMRILTPIKPELYKPKGSPELLDKLNKLSWIEKAQYTELQTGTILTHAVWLVKKSNDVVATENLPWDEMSVPCRASWMPQDAGMETSDIRRGLKDGDIVYETSMGGDETEEVIGDGSLPALGPAMIRQFDCKRTLQEIYVIVKGQAKWEFDFKIFLSHAQAWRIYLMKGRAVHTLH